MLQEYQPTRDRNNKMAEQVDGQMDMEGNTFCSNNKQIEKKKINFDNFCQMKNIMLDNMVSSGHHIVPTLDELWFVS